MMQQQQEQSEDPSGAPAADGMGPDCRKAMQQLWQYIDGALAAGDTEAVRAHIADCALCRPHDEWERRLLRQLSSVRRDHDDLAGLRINVLQALRRAGMPGH